LLQLDPPLPLNTPRGDGWAHFVIDYGQEHDLLWVVFLNATGECWSVPNPQVRLQPNWSLLAARKDEIADAACAHLSGAK